MLTALWIEPVSSHLPRRTLKGNDPKKELINKVL